MEEKPGPVHLELPEDIAAQPVSDGTHLFPPHPIRRPVPDDKSIANAIELLKAAKRPLLCIAAGANRKRVQNMVRRQPEPGMAMPRSRCRCRSLCMPARSFARAL